MLLLHTHRKWTEDRGQGGSLWAQVHVAILTCSDPPPGSTRHNDLPWQLLTKFNNRLLDQRANLTSLAHTETSIPKLKAGFVGGQVQSASPALSYVRVHPSPLAPGSGAAPPWSRCTPSPRGHRSLETTPIAPGCGDGFQDGKACRGQGRRQGLGPQVLAPIPTAPVLVCVHTLQHPEQRCREEDAGADRRHPSHVPDVP